MGDADSALAEAQLENYPPSKLGTLAILHAAKGQARQAAEARKQLAQEYPVEGVTYLAAVEARAGNGDATFKLLERAAEQQDVGLALIADDWAFRPLHDDPRWLPFLRKIQRAPEQLAAIRFKVPDDLLQ
jgi:hypothetical protein